MSQHYEVIVVGGGLAGLTTAAYLAKNQKNVCVIEKEPYVGGLVGSFVQQGFTFDRGARSIESSGIILPMLKDLGIPLEFIPSPVMMKFGNESISLSKVEDIDHYESLLVRLFPQEESAIHAILKDIHKIMGYMDVLYGIDNPLFMKMPPDPEYMKKVLFPWMLKFLPSLHKAMSYMEPIQEQLKKYTAHQPLIDLIAQHFFENTPAFFALSYFTLYLEYKYPKGGTGVFPNAMETYILSHKGTILTNTLIEKLNPETKALTDSHGTTYTYDQLVWAADLKVLYRIMPVDEIRSPKLKKIIRSKQSFLKDKKGADSVLTLYLGVNQSPDNYATSFGPHAFVTPDLSGVSSIPLSSIQLPSGDFVKDKNQIFQWMETYLERTTHELSIPCLRDGSLAPQNQTGLIISVLFPYDLAKHIFEQGWYEEFKQFTQEKIIVLFDRTYQTNFQKNVVYTAVATPLTIERYTLSTEGSLSGWSFKNKPFPATISFLKVTQSVKTPVPSISQAGQWTFNPAGIPIAVLTGRLAADRSLKLLKKTKR